MENPNNLAFVCKDCAEKIHEETQSRLPPIGTLVGKHVKKAFTYEEHVEHMWVKVTAVNETANTLIGVLDNEPFFVQNVALHDEVIVYLHEIEAVYL